MSYKEGDNGILATEHFEVVFHGIIHLSADPNPGRHTGWEIIPKSDPTPERADRYFPILLNVHCDKIYGREIL